MAGDEESHFQVAAHLLERSASIVRNARHRPELALKENAGRVPVPIREVID